jgi:hypothetical protein
MGIAVADDMRWQAWGLGVGLLGISGGVLAQELPPAPPPPTAADAPATQPADSVAEPPQSVKVGDVIMAPALRDEGGEEPSRAKAAEKHWYGGPILLTDGIAYGSLALGFEVEKTAPGALPIGGLTYALGGPIVHLVHGNWGRSAISVGARVALPIVGLAIGANTDDGYDGSSGGTDRMGALLGGVLIGMVAATLVDAGLLAYEPVAESPTVAPTVSLGKDHAVVGAAGTF